MPSLFVCPSLFTVCLACLGLTRNFGWGKGRQGTVSQQAVIFKENGGPSGKLTWERVKGRQSAVGVNVM